MSNKFVVILVFSALVLAGLCLVQGRKASLQKQQITALRQAAEAAEQKSAGDRTRLQHLEKQRTRLSSEAQALETEVQTLQQNLAVTPKSVALTNPPEPPNAASTNEGLSGMLSKMMEDPAMKKMIREQQKAMMDTVYGSLIKQMALSPDEAAKFKDLILDKQMKAMTQGMTMFQGGGTETDRAEAMKKISDEQKQFNEQLKEFLGEGRYAQYNEYTESLGERMILSQFQQQATTTDFPLRDDQSKQLLQVMKEENKNVRTAFNGSDPNATEQVRQFKMMSSDDEMNRFFDLQEQANQRVYERARSILSPEQLNSFATFQSNQVNMQRVGLNMARRMMGSDRTEAPVTPK